MYVLCILLTPTTNFRPQGEPEQTLVSFFNIPGILSPGHIPIQAEVFTAG